MTRLGAKKMRERRQIEEDQRQRIRTWFMNGRPGHLVIDPRISESRVNALLLEEELELRMPALEHMARVAAATRALVKST